MNLRSEFEAKEVGGMRETIATAVLPRQTTEAPPESPASGLQIRNILCPVDFSEFSSVAFRYANVLAHHFGARIYLHHTLQTPQNLLLGTMDATVVQGAFEAERLNQKERLTTMIESEGPERPETVPLLNEGEPITNILEIIKAQNIDLLILGTHGHKGFNRLVLGSVAEQVIHEATCPVLVVSKACLRKGGFITPSSLEPLPLRTIVLATDFSPASDRALTYALRWASEWHGKVILFHAVEEVPSITQGRVDLFPEYNPSFEQQIARAWEKVRHLVPEAAGKGCEVAYEVRHGHPKEEILRVAEEKGADLIVMGARGRGKGTHAWGSNSSAVVRGGTFPVLVVRQLTG
jgi:nucleotide-binding universal stress UspA family protein